MNAPIKLIKGFLSKEESESMIRHIDHLEETKPGRFRYGPENPMVFMEFGKDFDRYGVTEDDLQRHGTRKLHELEILEQSARLQIVSVFKRIVETIYSEFDEPDELYVNECRIAKYYPGVTVPIHSDTDDGFSSHLKYSAIVYFNTMTKGGGEVVFMDHDYSHSPEQGDLVLFPCLEGGYHKVTEILETRYSIALWCTDRPELALC